MKKKTPEQELKELCKEIRSEIDHWDDINRNGCNDPFWSDGCNMNLTRNHIIYAKRQIAELCAEYSIPIPEEMYFPIPPEVSDYYMAHLRDKDRVRGLHSDARSGSRQSGSDMMQGSCRYSEGGEDGR